MPRSRRHTRQSGTIVTLRLGYEIDLRETDGLEHLFNAIIGETLRLARRERLAKKRFWECIHCECHHELHYVAGPLLERKSTIHLGMLLDEFGVHWDMIADRLNRP